MGFTLIKEVKKPCRHEGMPNVNTYGIGTIIECDQCGTQFMLRDEQREGRYWSIQSKIEAYYNK